MKIFLSYASEHRETAERICLKLINAGHDVFFDRHDLQPGHSFDLKIKEEVERCDLFIFLLTPESIESGSYALTEVDLAQRKWLNPEGRVLVVDLGMLQGQTVPPYLRANIHLSPKGDPATETLFAVENMSKGRQPSESPVQSTAPIGAAPFFRRWVLPFAFALVVAIGIWAAYQIAQKPGDPAVKFETGVGAGEGINVSGTININQGAAGSPPKTPEE